ncbi:MAG: enoyl-CoA hydratase [Alphaproteobacteria bacterium]|nr:enoyl-CoA hydratase [Alphaproteobacteria bacterium]MBU1513759.1 enoyl-CoA hydratase [Alphaproteobacteria bacterium]MBU2094596.1 enoyl-CoA hydratase [Alphaproteobacteria bacterium]MBU2150335.1 enoyl-CoA hydratase [Alphaproteobacteria bacterium]MBU2309136.1 enoyl-CoA hydratase [Alphaproteobacteria bacterium]
MLLVEKPLDGVAVVTFNRPEAMNALSKALRAELQAAFVALGDDPEVRVIVLTGAGERAFTAGLDLKELSTDPLGMGAANAVDPAQNPARAVLACPKPIIGAINGVAITGGFEVALACDVLICSTNARFADTHARVGITPGWGLSQKLSRCIGPYRAKELSLTGNFLDAAKAYEWGLVNRVVAPEELMPAALQLAAQMADIDADMLVTYKAMIDDGYAMAMGEGLELEHSRSVVHNREVTPEMVAARRAAVQARGRNQ